METNLILYFSPDGVPSKVLNMLKGLGFKVNVGRYDLFYTWDKEASEQEIMALADKVANALKGTGTLFKLETA